MCILHVSINSTEQSAVIILGTLIIFWLFYKLKNRIIYRFRPLENREIIYKLINYSFLSSLIMKIYLKKFLDNLENGRKYLQTVQPIMG